ncbi:hypothetical protein ACQPW3_06000 [Actinosynnema sp. CA-248983]
MRVAGEVVGVVCRVRGEVVGLTEVIRRPSRRDEFYQGDTAVVAAHRGRRIGAWLKGELPRWPADDPAALEQRVQL